MNTGQMLLTIAGMMLLSLVIMRVNNNFLTTNTVLMNSKFEVLATSIGTSIVEEATSKSFDEKTDTNAVNNTSELSDVLGPDSAETYQTYDDFDDFNGYTRIDSTLPSAIFKLTCTVDYVSPADPDTPLAGKSWNKKISVTVTSPSMQDTIKMSSIFSYWYFR